MTSPAVSLLLAVRNEERFLPAALASIFRQSFTDWELVAVDDGSTDGTPAILAQAGQHFPDKVRIIRQPAKGLVEALNLGLERCRAPLVARMDGDDVCHPHRLFAQHTYMQYHPEVAVISCHIRHFPRPQLSEGMKTYEAWQNSLLTHEDIQRDRYVESPLTHPSVMYRRQAVLAAGGYRELPWAEDYDLWLRLIRAGARFARLPRTLFYWRDRPDRLTRTAANCKLTAMRNCKIHYLCHDYLKDHREVTLWGAGLEGKAWRKALLRQGIHVVRWVDVDPRKVGQTIHGAPVIAPTALQPDQGKMLITVGAAGARQQIRQWADRNGLKDQHDFVCVT
ncbi:MAG: glycosyltransferase [Desulfuromonadales bacterium]